MLYSLQEAASKDSVLVRLGLGDGTFATARQSYELGPSTRSASHAGRLQPRRHARHRGRQLRRRQRRCVSGHRRRRLRARSRYPMGRGSAPSISNVDRVADFDRDGNLDIATPETGGRAVCAAAAATGPSRPAATLGGLFSTVGGAVADFNRDGWPDLAFSESCEGLDFWPDCRPLRSVYVFFNWTGRSAPPCVVPEVSRRERAAGSRAPAATRRLPTWEYPQPPLAQDPQRSTDPPAPKRRSSATKSQPRGHRRQSRPASLNAVRSAVA